jgi:hypothetical protein
MSGLLLTSVVLLIVGATFLLFGDRVRRLHGVPDGRIGRNFTLSYRIVGGVGVLLGVLLIVGLALGMVTAT